VLIEEGFALTRKHEVESIFAIGNGLVGSRASVAERTNCRGKQQEDDQHVFELREEPSPGRNRTLGGEPIRTVAFESRAPRRWSDRVPHQSLARRRSLRRYADTRRPFGPSLYDGPIEEPMRASTGGSLVVGVAATDGTVSLARWHGSLMAKDALAVRNDRRLSHQTPNVGLGRERIERRGFRFKRTDRRDRRRRPP
jgi:hypothetical protein